MDRMERAGMWPMHWGLAAGRNLLQLPVLYQERHQSLRAGRCEAEEEVAGARDQTVTNMRRDGARPQSQQGVDSSDVRQQVDRRLAGEFPRFESH